MVPTRCHVTLALLLAACVGSPPVPRSSLPRPAKLLPRSSVAAVLGHRAELGLDDDQVRRLEAIDDDLQRQNAALGARAAPGPGASRLPEGAQPTEGRSGNGSAAGGAMGRHRGGPRGAGGRAAPPIAGRAPGPTADDNDTAAYYRAEEVLRPEQRERAREIAERYREDLYDQRAAQKTQARP